MTLASTCRDNGDILITSGDSLTIENAAEFRRLLREGLEGLEGLEGAQTVAVELAEGVRMDLTALQLLCSACKSAAAGGKSFVRQGPRPPALDELIEACGAGRHAACTQNLKSNCIWFGGA